MKIIILAFTVLATTIVAEAQWIKQTVNTTASLRGLSVVNDKIVWASGTGGTVIRTINGGETWNVITVPGAEKLDFRDIEAFDANTAYILSIGNGENSRIYKTADGGKRWDLQFKNDDPKMFFDAIACLRSNICLAMSDPVDGNFILIRTLDGKKWEPVTSAPSAKVGEAGFAASGTCLIWGRGPQTFIVSGGSNARVFRGELPDDTFRIVWEPVEIDFTHGTSGSGIFSIAMLDNKNGVIVGGDYEKPDEAKNNFAYTANGGKSWTLGAGLKGYRSGVTYVNKNILIAVGTNGSDISYDGGKTWSSLDKENYNSVQSKGLSSTWAVGPKGRVALCPILQLQKPSRQ